MLTVGQNKKLELTVWTISTFLLQKHCTDVSLWSIQLYNTAHPHFHTHCKEWKWNLNSGEPRCRASVGLTELMRSVLHVKTHVAWWREESDASFPALRCSAELDYTAQHFTNTPLIMSTHWLTLPQHQQCMNTHTHTHTHTHTLYLTEWVWDHIA